MLLFVCCACVQTEGDRRCVCEYVCVYKRERERVRLEYRKEQENESSRENACIFACMVCMPVRNAHAIKNLSCHHLCEGIAFQWDDP